jgi:hypothetical protein
MVMALKSAKLAGLTIDDQSISNALAWVDQMTIRRTADGLLRDGRSALAPAPR